LSKKLGCVPFIPIAHHSFPFLFPLVFSRADKIKKLAIFFVFAKLTT